MIKYVSAGLCLALVASTASTAAQAQNMTTEEILQRIEIQRNTPKAQPLGGATRGLQVLHGAQRAAPPQPQPVETTERGLTVIYDDGGATEPTSLDNQNAAMAPPTMALEPVTQPYQDTGAYQDTAVTYSQDTVPYVTEGVVTTPVAYDTVPLETYQAVQDDARIDLRIYFELDSASLKPEAIGQLSQLCAAISQAVSGQSVFKIIGHTDKSGSPEYNLYLSRARAREVKRHLVEECAIPSNSLLATGEGERQSNPGSPQLDPAERRVEVQIVS